LPVAILFKGGLHLTLTLNRSYNDSMQLATPTNYMSKYLPGTFGSSQSSWPSGRLLVYFRVLV